VADVAATTDLPVLAVVPKATKRQQRGLGLATANEPDGVFADSYQKLRSSLEFLSLETVAGSDGSARPVTSVMITSANPAEGKSTTSANLALAMSSVGRRTVLVDLDFRRPTVHSMFGVSQDPGLSDFVLRGVDMSKIAYSLPSMGSRDLLIMPSGSVPPNPASFVGTKRFLSTIGWLETQADVVLFDTPPLLAVSDGHTISKHVDAVVLTARAGATTKSELAEAVTAINQVGANLVGIVLIGVDEPEGYGKRSYYGEFTGGKGTPSEPVLDLNAEELWAEPRAIEATNN
jgi:capsular exopolysaccharide synthesis family protein